MYVHLVALPLHRPPTLFRHRYIIPQELYPRHLNPHSLIIHCQVMDLSHPPLDMQVQLVAIQVLGLLDFYVHGLPFR